MPATHLTAPTRFIEVDGDRFAYRRWGRPSGVPLYFVPHFRAGLDHWDPLLTDGLAEDREVILFNGRGIASSSGTPRHRIDPDAGHGAQFQYPDRFLKHAIQFLEE
jgi:pimeloyl-ACP methyl ester carboxylesterase